MDEELVEILSNENLDQSAMIEAIKGAVGKGFIPRNKYNDISKRVKELEDDNAQKDEKIKGFENASLSDNEKLQKALKEAEEIKKEALKDRNKTQAEKILLKAELSDDEIEEIIDGIVSEDLEATKAMATKIANVITKQKEAKEKKVKEELIKNQPKPNGGNGKNEKIMTEEEFYKLTFDKQIEFKEKNPETYKKIMGL